MFVSNKHNLIKLTNYIVMGQRCIIPVMGQSVFVEIGCDDDRINNCALYDCVSSCLERTYVYCKCSNR